MYLDNKYTVWYTSIINSAKTRSISGYTENHHIIPKSLGGSNKKDNLVALTAREHFVCHRLLPKMVVGEARHKMLAAQMRMAVNRNNLQQRVIPNSRTFSIIREEWATEHSKWMTGKFSGDKNPNYGNIMSQESKNKISLKKLGIAQGTMSTEHKNKISIAQKGIKKPHSSVAIKKSWEVTHESRVGEYHPMYGKQHTDETKQKMKQAAAARWTIEAREEASRKKKEANRLKNKEVENAKDVTL